LVRFEESAFFVEEQLVKLGLHKATPTLQCKLTIDYVDESFNTGVPGLRISELEFRHVELEAVAYFGVNDSLTTLTERTLLAFGYEQFGVPLAEREADVADTLNSQTWIGRCCHFTGIRKGPTASLMLA
jgi:hypothetical protein